MKTILSLMVGLSAIASLLASPSALSNDSSDQAPSDCGYAWRVNRGCWAYSEGRWVSSASASRCPDYRWYRSPENNLYCLRVDKKGVIIASQSYDFSLCRGPIPPRRIDNSSSNSKSTSASGKYRWYRSDTNRLYCLKLDSNGVIIPTTNYSADLCRSQPIPSYR